MWVRGLKPYSLHQLLLRCSRILCGCVDWNVKEYWRILIVLSRILCGCVDWNFWATSYCILTVCRILCGCVDWNCYKRDIQLFLSVASYVGAWIETSLQKSHSCAAHLCRTPCGCVDSNICLMKSSPRCNWRTPSAKMWRCTSSPCSCVALAKSTYISASHPSTLRRRFMPTS